MTGSTKDEIDDVGNIEDYWLRLPFDRVSTGDLLTAITYLETTHAPLLSRWLLQYFHYRLEEGEPFDVNPLLLMLKNFLGKLFGDAPITADQALGLAMRKGKYNRGCSEGHYMQAAALVLIELRKGEKWLDAVSLVSGMVSISEATIAKAYQCYRPFIDHFPDEALREFANGPFELGAPPTTQLS